MNCLFPKSFPTSHVKESAMNGHLPCSKGHFTWDVEMFQQDWSHYMLHGVYQGTHRESISKFPEFFPDFP